MTDIKEIYTKAEQSYPFNFLLGSFKISDSKGVTFIFQRPARALTSLDIIKEEVNENGTFYFFEDVRNFINYCIDPDFIQKGIFTNEYCINEVFQSIWDEYISSVMDNFFMKINKNQQPNEEIVSIRLGFEKMYDIIIKQQKSKSKEMIENLTKSEYSTMMLVLNKINYTEGDISVNNLIETGKTTRAVIKSTITKMSSYGVIETENRGVKGTHIKLIDPKLLNLLGIHKM